MSAAAESLRHAMQSAMIDYGGPIHGDGRLHRIKAAGDKAANCYYILHDDEYPVAFFGCWRRSFSQTWQAKRDIKPSAEQWRAMKAKWQAAEAEQAHTDAEIKAAAREKARFIFSNSERVDLHHPYLVAKGAGVHGELRQYKGALVVPLRDELGALHSLQFICGDGIKRFLHGGRIAGTFFTVADTDGPCVLCEGYATGASIHEATNYTTVCAMNAGNLLPVAKALREKWPAREFIVAADDDRNTPGNPGRTKAVEAARAIRARVAVPTFKGQ